MQASCDCLWLEAFQIVLKLSFSLWWSCILSCVCSTNVTLWQHVIKILSDAFARFLVCQLCTYHNTGLSSAIIFAIFDDWLHTHTSILRPYGLSQGLPGLACTRKVKPVWILLKQKTMSGSGISLAICKSAPRPRQITTPVWWDDLPATQPTASKHWRHCLMIILYH